MEETNEINAFEIVVEETNVTDNDVEYVEIVAYKVYEDGKREIAYTARKPKSVEKHMNPEQEAQLDRDEIMCDMALNIADIKLNQELSMMGGDTV